MFIQVEVNKLPELLIKTKTPLWTGDIDTESDIVQSTGIIGSIRWWFESILRGVDKFACDPTNNDPKTNNNRCPPRDNGQKMQYCTSCLIFGATGIRRLFRLDIGRGENVFSGSELKIRPSNRKGGWYLGSGIKGEIKLGITPLDKDFDENLILIPLIISSKWGGIGAKTQHGYGVVELEDPPDSEFNKFKEALNKITNMNRLSKLKEDVKIEERKEGNTSLPNIKEMFFLKVQFEVKNNNEWWKKVDGIAPRGQKGKRDYYEGYTNDSKMIEWVNSGSVPIAPAIKNWLRYGAGTGFWKPNNQNLNKRVENWLFGTKVRVCRSCYEEVRRDKNNFERFWCQNCKKSLDPKETLNKNSSKINISCAYHINGKFWEFRIWGWIPKNNLPAGFDREKFLDNLRGSNSNFSKVPLIRLLGDQIRNPKLVWREYDSQRDTVKQNEKSIENYLQSLLIGEEGSQ